MINNRFVMFVVLFFAFFGLLVSLTYVHEYSHYLDYKDYVNNPRICILDNKLNGYFHYYVNPNLSKPLIRIDSFTEFKAYGLEVIVFLALFYFVFVPYFKEALRR